MLKNKNFIMGLLAASMLMFGSSFSYAADPNKGSELYVKHCAACHGASGISEIPRVPNFAQSEGLMTSDPALLISIKSGKLGMPAFRGVLSDLDILDVIAYLRTLY
jgi:cytochrome c6